MEEVAIAQSDSNDNKVNMVEVDIAQSDGPLGNMVEADIAQSDGPIGNMEEVAIAQSEYNDNTVNMVDADIVPRDSNENKEEVAIVSLQEPARAEINAEDVQRAMELVVGVRGNSVRDALHSVMNEEHHDNMVPVCSVRNTPKMFPLDRM